MQDLLTRPWISMWTSPRKTIARIIQGQEKHRFFLLSIFYGWQMTMQIAQNNSLSELLPFWAILGLTLVAAPLLGMLSIVVVAGLLYWTGRWLGGVGSFFSLRCAVSWANITSIVIVLLGLFIAFTFKEVAFCNSFVQMPMSPVLARVLLGGFVLQFIASVWMIYLLVVSVSEVQGFSVGKALINVIAASLVAFVCSWIISFFIGAIEGINL